MSTITPDAPKRFTVAREPYYTAAWGRAEYAVSDLVKVGDVVTFDDGPDGEGDVLAKVERNGVEVYLAFDALDEIDEAPAISEADVEAFVEAIGIETETVEVPAILDALTSIGMSANLAEAAVALAQRRSAR